MVQIPSHYIYSEGELIKPRIRLIPHHTQGSKLTMSTLYHIKEHVIEGQHIREYAQATAHSNEEVLKLAVKQYIPKDNPNPKPGDITIIASHANGFVKVKRTIVIHLHFDALVC